MTHNAKEKPDAFKEVMAAAKLQLGRTDLPHQSLGRALLPQEEALADALMEIYAAGAIGRNAIAAALTLRGVVSPISGTSDWTADSLAEALAALNSDLDNAYNQNGFGG